MGPHLTPALEKALLAHCDEHGLGSVIGRMLLGWLILFGTVIGMVLLLASCGTPSYSSDSENSVPVTGDAGVELADWFERTCRLAHERAYFEVGRSDRADGSGWSTHTRNEFRSAEHANQIGKAFALEVSLPWTEQEGSVGTFRGYVPHTESTVYEHASGAYIPPRWVEDGTERQVVADWYSADCEMSDPYSAGLDYSADPDRVTAATDLISEHSLLETAELPDDEDRQSPYARCDEGRCPAGTVFS